MTQCCITSLVNVRMEGGGYVAEKVIENRIGPAPDMQMRSKGSSESVRGSDWQGRGSAGSPVY